MKKATVYVLIFLGCLLLGIAAANARFAADPSFLVGTFLPGFLFLIGGIYLRGRESAPRSPLWVLLTGGIFLAALGACIPLLLSRALSEDETTAWTYRSDTFGFTIGLPSSEWREINKPGMTVAFHNPKRSILAGIRVAKQTRETFFDKTVKEVADLLAESPDDYLSKPERTEGETREGNPYVCWTVIAKADGGGSVFVGFGLVWCKDKSLAVKVVYEGALRMRSDSGKAGEKAYLEKAFKTIALSVQ